MGLTLADMMNRNTLVAVDHRRRLAVFYNGFRGFIVTRFDEANNVQLLRLVVEDVEDDELREIFTLGRLILDGFCEEDEETKGTKPKKSLDDCTDPHHSGVQELVRRYKS